MNMKKKSHCLELQDENPAKKWSFFFPDDFGLIRSLVIIRKPFSKEMCQDLYRRNTPFRKAVVPTGAVRWRLHDLAKTCF